jgi:hypothetical protein
LGQAREFREAGVNLIKQKDPEAAQEYFDMITQLGPAGSDEELFKQYAGANMELPKSSIDADDEMTENIKTWILLTQLSKRLDSGKSSIRELQNNFIDICVKGRVDRIQAEGIGFVDYKFYNKNSKVRDAYLTAFKEGEYSEQIVDMIFNNILELTNKI